MSSFKGILVSELINTWKIRLELKYNWQENESLDYFLSYFPRLLIRGEEFVWCPTIRHFKLTYIPKEREIHIFFYGRKMYMGNGLE